MKTTMKNLSIGAFTLVGIAVFIFFLIFLHPYTGDKGQILKVRFADLLNYFKGLEKG